MAYKVIKRGNKYRVGYSENGVVKQQSFSTEKEAQDFAMFKTASKTVPKAVETPEELLTLIDQYILIKYSNKSPFTSKNAKSSLRINLPKFDWKNPNLLALRLAVKDYRSNTAREHLKNVREFLKYAGVKTEIDWQEIFKQIRKQDQKEKHFLTEEEFSKIVEASPDKFKILWLIMGSFGPRRYELIRLKVSNFNKDTFTITLTKTKSGKMRSFVIPHEIRDLFLANSNWNSANKNEPLFHNNMRDKDGNLKEWSFDYLSQTFKQITEKLGMKDGNSKNIHLLRAYTFKLLTKHGASDTLIRRAVGWDSQAMMKYTGMMEEEKEELAAHISFKPEDRASANEDLDELLGNIAMVNSLTLKLDNKGLAARAHVSFPWLDGLMKNRRNKELENFVKVVRALNYRIVIEGEDAQYNAPGSVEHKPSV